MTRQTQKSPRARVRSLRQARGFALPLVLMLGVICALGVVILLERQTVSQLAVVRHVKGYTTFHQAAGLREVINRWMPTVRGRLSEMVESDGLAFKINMPRSGMINVYMSDAQGTVLLDPSTLAGRRRDIVEALQGIFTDPPPSIATKMLEGEPVSRLLGPPEVCIRSASPAVIEAIMLAVLLDEKQASVAAEAVIRKREDLAASSTSVSQPGATVRIAEVLRPLGIAEEDIADIDSMFVGRNTLWNVVAEAVAGGEIFERSGGLYEATEARVEAYNQNAGFLSWNVLPLQTK